MGRRAVLALGSALMVGSGILFATVGNYWVLLAAAVFGVISPSGNEIGPFRAVEESTLAHLTPHDILSDIFAWYSLIGNAGTALGMMTGGWAINLLQVIWEWPYIPACRVIFFAYAAIGALKLLLSIALSSAVEAEEKQKKPTCAQQTSEGETRPLLSNGASNPTSPDQRRPKKSLLSFVGDAELVSLVIRLAILFGLDSFASGLASLSWMTYFFKRKFSLPEGTLGSIFFTTSLISAASVLVASSIAKRIGNVKTMVFTHLPSAVCLALIPVPAALPLALTFLVLRSCSQTMEVAPRSAFLAAALPSDRRTAIMGSINVVKTCAQSLGPLLTGVLADRGYFGLSFTIAGILKAVYDIGMLLSFAGKEKQARRPAPADQGEETA
ncbi:MFS general substrate transporter [Aspergillus sclerotioniger CBS 115572]|uniref:MFS general substrate transporter n=1 Tax=Aspergillus sclerotioniger CBS 115572 TaxID=1450535 RepID=A0A317XHQ5_9EURO|nr:MFS general substrate transporter [Aspergillus sclerotioniger CBS 115572]PWY96780.1 MFS general substrate transporter [Aspergillus sclerotioniger CBS 115572]